MTGHHVFFFVKIMINIVQLIWRFPEMVVPPSSSMFDGIFHCKAIIWCYLHRVGHLQLCAHHFRGIFQAMRRYTAVHLARIYPAGYRVDSSNYDPQVLSDVDVQSQDVMSWRM